MNGDGGFTILIAGSCGYPDMADSLHPALFVEACFVFTWLLHWEQSSYY